MTTNTHRRKLDKAPITLALCQIRFSPLADMATYASKVQVALRKDGYRLDMSGQVQEIVFGPQGPQVRPFDRWEFLNVEKSRSAVLTGQFAAFQTTVYTNFEDFVPEVIRLMDALTAAGADVLIMRVGLRYVNAIIPSKGKNWRSYLAPTLHGIQLPAVTSPLSAYHVFGETSHGRLLARMTQNTEGMLVPIEMGQQNLALQTQAPPAGTTVTLVDIDHFKEWNKDFPEYQPATMQRLLWDLKGVTYEAFRSFVTDSAVEEWK